MWVFLNNAFLSIVADKGNKNLLLVRAREAQHIENVFPEAEVKCTRDTDYAYRSFIGRKVVSERLKDYIENIQYTNFKNSIQDEDYHEACFEVWEIMSMYQGSQQD